ncbi:hypothetical protein KR074_011338 [Drosophila pseudoananassae]|nr:hypothetical protein KR074_011338 [Drosophila pseudoananassae]
MVRAQKKSKSKQVCRPPSQVQKPRPSFNNRGPPSSYQRPPPSFVNRPSPVPHPLLNRTPTVNRPPLTPYPLDYPPSVQHPTVNRPPSNQAPIVSRPPPPQAEDRQQLRDRQIQQDRQAPPRAVNSPQKPPAAGPKLPELDAEVQRVQQELCRVRKQQEEQLRAQQRFEEKERNLQELQDSLLQELQKKLETDLQARIEGQLQARFEKKLQAFREQNERSLREQASALEKLRKERQEQERRDKEKREQEQLERERQLNERNLKEKELRELERRKKERQEQERREKDRQDQERREKDRQDLERREKERRDKERREKEHQEQERREKERQDQERREKERREKERREKDRQDQEQREKERHKLEQREKDRHAPERRKTDPEDLDPTIDVIEYQIKDPKTMRSAKVDQEKILVSIGNGKNGQSHAQSNGQSKPPLRAILGNSAPLRNNNPTTAMSTSYKRPMHPRIPYPGQGRSSGVSVNHRLKQNPPTEDSIPSPKSMPITPPISPESAKVTQAPKVDVLRLQAPQPPKDTRPEKQISIEAYSPDTDLDPVELLKQYCLANQFDEPVYNFFKTPSKLHCSVRIQGEVYSTYPEEFANEKAACERTALVAIDRIKHAEVRKKLAACTITDEDFIDSLYEELQKFPHGILGHKMEVWYSETFGRHLPSHWYDLVVESKKIRVEHGINPRTIIFANAPGSPEPVRIAPPTVMSALELPWQPNDSGSNDWNMYISHCDSTKQVWARLIDDIASFDELTTHMGRHMAVPLFRQQVETPDEGDLYLVEIREGWNRVRVLSVDKEQRSCRCHFVDFGDMAQFQFNDLYRCPPQFLVLPAQAICLSMYALDKFEDHPHALPVLMAELDGQTVVARVLTTPKQFQELGGAAQGLVEKNKRKACLVATLYDTSTAEDIHLNDLVAARITKSTPAPSLNDEKMVVKTSPVLVSHITDDGDLVVLLRNDDLKFVERSIATTVADLGEKDRVRFSDLLHDRHVFVCDESGDGSKQWYRGRLVFKPTNPEEETFDVFYVDDGRQRKTHISNIYRLEANNRALATYPPQALLVGLHDVPDMCGQLLPRLRGLLPPRCEALLKVVVKDGAKPLVNLFIRGNDPESMYMCVNIGLRLEFEMQSSTRPDNYDDLHTSSNYLLPRRNSLSSVVSSQSSGSDLLAVTPPVTPQRASTRGAATTFSTGLLKDYEAIPAIGAFFEVRVSLSINPGHFAVQPYKCYNQLQCLMKELQAHCQGNMAKGVEPSQLAIGEAYAAPDTDGVYHRVNIRKIYDEIIHVRFVDVGDDGVVACEQLKTLPAELRKLPKMGLAAQLYGIQLEDVVWSQENCVRFRKLTLGQKFIGIVRGSHKLKDGSRSLSLELVDTSTPQDIKLHEILINEKHAQPETKEV